MKITERTKHNKIKDRWRENILALTRAGSYGIVEHELNNYVSNLRCDWYVKAIRRHIDAR